MQELLPIYTWVPLLGFLISLFVPSKNERAVSGVAIATVTLQLVGIVAFILLWIINSTATQNIKYLVLYSAAKIEIAISYYFDKTTAVFAITGAILTFIITIFSRYYIHRDGGFKRFFSTILLFFLGYNLLVFSGNYETLFIGWELLGVCTFLLVSFYRERYLPVKNSIKIISVYRLADICLILAMWMGHHIWHENISFIKLDNPGTVAEHLSHHYPEAIFISVMIFIAAAIKSAQLPFTSWLPRAMEGPTTSSAIFYGSLSVHIGVFLLLRTYPYWESLASIKILIIATGLLTSIIAINIAQVQSAIKAQIAYSSVAQIGLMFVEIALGFHVLALVHFTGNALLRTYQLLVSPSVQSYYIHDLFFSFIPKKQNSTNAPFAKIKNTVYMLSLKEWNMDTFQYSLFWKPFKWLGVKMGFLAKTQSILAIGLIYIVGLYCYYFSSTIPVDVYSYLPYFFSLSGLVLILISFAERGNAIRAWFLVVGGQLFITLAVALHNEEFGHQEIAIYLSGTVVATIVGYFSLKRIKSIDNDIDLNRFHGYVYEQPTQGIIFLISCLGLLGLPFTPSFIGIDLLFSHIHKQEVFLIAVTALGFLFMELSILRVYARIFMGQHKKANHAIAYRSS